MYPKAEDETRALRMLDNHSIFGAEHCLDTRNGHGLPVTPKHRQLGLGIDEDGNLMPSSSSLRIHTGYFGLFTGAEVKTPGL